MMVKYANLLASDRNNKITICALISGGPLETIIDDNVLSLSLDKSRLFKSLFGIVRTIKIARPNIILSSNPVLNLSLLAVKLFSPTRINLIIREATTPSKEINKRLRVKFIQILCKMFYHYSNAFIAPSNGVKNDLVEYYKIRKDKIAVIFNPVINQTLKVKEIGSRKSSLNKICFFGRIDPVKRIEIQIDAIRILRDHYQVDCMLEIFGPIVNRKYYKSLTNMIIQNSLDKLIHFKKPIRDVEEILPNFDIMLLTSLYEGLPSVLIEGLNAGIKIIACNCLNGPKEILDGGKYGILLDNCTSDEIAKIIANRQYPAIKEEELKIHLYKYSRAHFFNITSQLMNCFTRKHLSQLK